MSAILQEDIDLITSLNYDTILAAKMQLEYVEMDPKTKKLYEDMLFSESLQFQEEIQCMADSGLAEIVAKEDNDMDLEATVEVPVELSNLSIDESSQPFDPKGKGKAVAGNQDFFDLPMSENESHETSLVPRPMPALLDECGICLESVTLYSSSSKSTEGVEFPHCKHTYCISCLSTWVSIETKNGVRPFPLLCPHEGCLSALEPGPLVHTLLDNEDLVKRFEDRYLEATRQSMYCPNDDCSKLIILDEKDDDSDVECSRCGFPVCAPCKSISHHPLTCQQFQGLPQDQKGLHDISLFSLAISNRWARCPSCQHMIEKREGCNHISCPCSCDFCYTCGKEYVHKKAGCVCNLFEVPPELQPNVIRAVAEPALDRLHLHQLNRPEDTPDGGFHFGMDGRRVPQYGTAELLTLSRHPAWLRKHYNSAECHYCSRTFNTFFAMRDHMLTTRSHAVFFCCNRTFQTPSCLEKHLNSVHHHSQ